MSASRQTFARWGENLAERYLVERGYAILGRNVRTPYGEIDLIARQVESDSPSSEGCLVTVFVEVKARSARRFGFPEESVTRRKRAHLLSAAQAYLQDHPELEGPWRIDVIAIERADSGRAPSIEHFENALA